MYGFFISFTKRELKTFVLLGTSLKVKFLLEVIVSLARVACSIGNTYAKDASAENASIESICTRGAYIKIASIESAGHFFIRSASVKSIFVGSA